MYDFFSQLAQVGGTIYFVVIFLAVCVYALWPKNKAKFDAAARLALSDKEPGDE